MGLSQSHFIQYSVLVSNKDIVGLEVHAAAQKKTSWFARELGLTTDQLC